MKNKLRFSEIMFLSGITLDVITTLIGVYFFPVKEMHPLGFFWAIMLNFIVLGVYAWKREIFLIKGYIDAPAGKWFLIGIGTMRLLIGLLNIATISGFGL
jgi:hypothetical protein